MNTGKEAKRKLTRRQAIKAWKARKDAERRAAPMLVEWVEDEERRQARHLREIARG